MGPLHAVRMLSYQNSLHYSEHLITTDSSSAQRASESTVSIICLATNVVDVELSDVEHLWPRKRKDSSTGAFAVQERKGELLQLGHSNRNTIVCIALSCIY